MRNIHYYIGLILLLVSCGPENIVQDAPVKLVSPKQSLSIKKDSTFDVKFSETLSCGDIYVVNDSIMLLYDMGASGNGGCFYKAYSLEDYSFMVEILREGRGPGEFLSPEIIGMYKSAEDARQKCYLWDMMLGMSYSLDLYAALNAEMDVIEKVSDLPANTIDVCPCNDSLQFVANLENDNVLFHIISKKSKKLKSFRLYPENTSAQRYLPAFSNNIAVSNEYNRAALVMLSMPQINFLDLVDGTVWSVAVDRKYKDWRNILLAATDMSSYMKSTQYYNNTETTKDFIMAIYLNRKREDIATGRQSQYPHLHIFDWNGNFLYDIKLDENISRIAYDSKRKYMYGLDTGDGNIYRYDLSHIL